MGRSLCLELTNAGWKQSRWDNGVIYGSEPGFIDSHTRVWISPSGKQFCEDAAYNVAYGITKESDYPPFQPILFDRATHGNMHITKYPK